MAIHPTALIDRKAELDSTVDVGPNCIIEGNVRVAAGCRLYQGVYLTGWTQIGEDCVLHPGVIVGHEPQDIKYDQSRTYCRIGRKTILREYVTVHRGTIPDSATIIGEECFLLAGAHVGHNCQIGNRVTLINNVLLGGHVEIGDAATIGGRVGVHQFVRIGELAMIAGCARVVLDVLPFALADVTGRISGLNRIGLRRAGMISEQISDLRHAYRILFERGRSHRDALSRLREIAKSPPCLQLVEFLESPSRRGLAGRSSTKRKTPVTHE